MNKIYILLTVLILLILTPVLRAEEFESAEAFTEYIYVNYAAENFAEVYNNFAAELKRILPEEDYLGFQQQNFKKYDLEYTEIEVSAAEEVGFEKIERKFNYAENFGSYYQLQVSYLVKFNHFGSREEKSEKNVYLRKINSDFQIFWDYANALNDDEAAAGADKDE